MLAYGSRDIYMLLTGPVFYGARLYLCLCSAALASEIQMLTRLQTLAAVEHKVPFAVLPQHFCSLTLSTIELVPSSHAADSAIASCLVHVKRQVVSAAPASGFHADGCMLDKE